MWGPCPATRAPKLWVRVISLIPVRRGLWMGLRGVLEPVCASGGHVNTYGESAHSGILFCRAKVTTADPSRPRPTDRLPDPVHSLGSR